MADGMPDLGPGSTCAKRAAYDERKIMYGIKSKTAKVIVLTLAALGVATFAAATAAAHDDHGVVYRKYDSDHRWHSYDRRYWKKYGHHGVTVYGWKPVGRWPSFHYGQARAACHAVVSNGRDHFGRRARFGGTMCYDRAGRAYVVPGSRYVIRYF